MQGEIEAIVSSARSEIASAGELDALERVRVRFLGRKGELTLLLRGLKELPAEERPAAGQALNRAKNEVEGLIQARREELEEGSLEVDGRWDLTLPGRRPHSGSRHLIHQTIERICDIFHGMGYTRADGPDVELDALNFTALNFPDDHPSRDLQDTFYINDEVVLRTQTSPVQVRYMREHTPPIAIVAPGRVYRQEQPDASHAAEFFQIEGLFVDRAVSMADLKATVLAFVREFSGEDEPRLRFRPHFFPFTEPSVEVDLWWQGKDGKGAWLEIMGAGMVHPHVFANCGYPEDAYTGFAFGMGIDRLAMVAAAIPDIRLLYDNDIRFHRQFPG